jgi:hypothetical protein
MDKWQTIEQKLQHVAWNQTQESNWSNLFFIPEFSEFQEKQLQVSSYKWFLLSPSNTSLELIHEDHCKIPTVQGKILIKNQWNVMNQDHFVIRKSSGKLNIVMINKENWTIAILRIPSEFFI